MSTKFKSCVKFIEAVWGRSLDSNELFNLEQTFNNIRSDAIIKNQSLDAPVTDIRYGKVIDYKIKKLETEQLKYKSGDADYKRIAKEIKKIKDDNIQENSYLNWEVFKQFDVATKRKEAMLELKKAIDGGMRLKGFETKINIVKDNITKFYGTKHLIWNRNPAKKIKQMQAKAIQSTIVDNNDTFGSVPLDKLMRVTGTEFFGDFHSKLDISFRKNNIDINHEKFMSDPKNLPDFMDEYSNFELNKGLNVTQKTKNTGAYLIAEALWTEVTLKAQSSFSKVARLMPYNRLGIKVRWNKHLTKRVKIDKDIQERFKNESKETQTREQFIKDVSEGLDLEFHGRKRKSIFGKGEVEGIDGMRSLAAQMYDNLMSGIEGKTDWRNIGDYDPKIIGKIAEWHGRKPRIGEEEVTGRVGMLKWKDGKSFAKITKKYGDEATLHQQITAHIQELSRDISVSQFLGGNHTVGLEKFMKIIDQTNLRNDIGVAQTRELDASLHYLKELVRPTIAEQAHGTTAFNVLRNLQAGAKLGSAVVTAILDIPVFITTGQRIFNLPLFGRDGLLATVFPGSGMVSGGKAARIKYARYFVEMTESWQNAAGARFILNDGMNNDTSWVRGSAAFAHMVFRGSGLNWWTKSLQSSAAGVYGRHLGELIQTKKTWNTLGEKFQNNLQKYGINETTWDNLVKNQHLFKDGLFDANGRLDMYKLGEGDIVVKNKVAKLVLGNDKGVSSTRSKFIAAVADAVDTMVMKPSQFDRMAGAFFIPEYQGTGAQIVRSMTQFKAHPISFFRKTVARNWQHQSSTDMLMSTAVIAASLIATSAVTIQLKEFIKGRPTYDASKMEFWQRVATESGTLGIVSDLMFSMFGGDKMIAGFQKDNNVRAMTKMDIINNVIGPLAADVLEVMDSGINLALAKDKKARAREFEDLAILATNQVPFKSIWWSKMLWRKYVTEYFSEMINPKGYRRAQKRIQKRLRKNRGTGIMFGKPIRSADGALMNFWKGGFN